MATDPSTSADAVAGGWLHNPATGEVAHLLTGPADTGGRRIEVDLWLQPGAAVARAHIHDHFVERFEVRAGAVGLQVGEEQRVARPSDGPVEVPTRTVHDWWNAGEAVALVRVEVIAAPTAPGRPAARFVSMIEALWSLGALGRVNAHGLPDPLWLAAIAREYRDAIRFTIPAPGEAELATLLARPVAARAARGRG